MKERGLRRRKKAKNVLQGFEQGAASLFAGVVEGVMGIVVQPFKEIKGQGAVGIFPGLIKGLTGVITKPLSGLLDTVSKTAEVILSESRVYRTLQEESWRTSKEQDPLVPFTMKTW